MEKDPIDWQKMERWSGALFGNVHRLPVAMAALELSAERDGIYPEAVRKRLDLPSSTRAIEQLDRLVEAGLLKKPREKRHVGKGPKRKVYAKRNDEFWDCLAALTQRRFSVGGARGHGSDLQSVATGP